MQKKFQKMLSLFIMFVIYFGSLPIMAQKMPSAAVSFTTSTDDIVGETTEYMAENNIVFEKAGYEFIEDDGRQIYAVYSQDSTVFQANQQFQKIVSVINVKATDGTEGIYITEASLNQNTLTFNLKQNGQTVASQQVNTTIPPRDPVTMPTSTFPCGGDISQYRLKQAFLSAIQTANVTCRLQAISFQYKCVLYCHVIIKPSSSQCRRFGWAYVFLLGAVDHFNDTLKCR